MRKRNFYIALALLWGVAALAAVWDSGYRWGHHNAMREAKAAVREAFDRHGLRACWSPAEMVPIQSGKTQRVIAPWRL